MIKAFSLETNMVYFSNKYLPFSKISAFDQNKKNKKVHFMTNTRDSWPRDQSQGPDQARVGAHSLGSAGAV